MTEVLEDKLSDQGFDATADRTVLSGLMALQNTYLAHVSDAGRTGPAAGHFRTGGGYNCAACWSGAAKWRCCVRSGIPPPSLGQIVLLENVLLLLAGLAAGVVAAVMAVLPHMFGGGAAIPFTELASMLGIVLLVGIAAGWLAARATLRVPVLAALREER